jgi:outer membrane protein assembly factor BamD (BamD/ComL family)
VSRRRLSKKQLKQDKFVSSTFELAQFLRTHTRDAAIGAAVLVVAAGGFLWYRNYSAHRQAAAARLLTSGRRAYEARNYPLAISDLERMRTEFSGTRLGQEALVMLADAYFQIEDYESARATLEAFVDRYGDDSQLSYRARVLLGCALENLEEYAEAARAYRQACDDAQFDNERIRARIDAARAFTRAGETEQAAEEYRYLLEAYPENGEAARAAMLLAELETRAGASGEPGEAATGS